MRSNGNWLLALVVKHKCILKSIILNIENHNVSTSNISLETLSDYIPITVTLSTPLETKLTTLNSFVSEQLFLIKKLIQEIKDLNHEATNSTYIATLMEEIDHLKEEIKVKNYIIQSFTNQ